MYPPHHQGGYEIVCDRVVRSLRGRGHEVAVLTSHRGVPVPRTEGPVRRWLTLDLPSDDEHRGVARILADAAYNRQVVSRLVSRLKPDLVHVFNPSGLGASLLHWLHGSGETVVHDICDTHLAHVYSADWWFALPQAEITSPARNLARPLLLSVGAPALGSRPVVIDLRRSYFRSRYLRDELDTASHLLTEGASVIYHGADLPRGGPSVGKVPGPHILFSGRLVHEKGAHVLVEALRRLDESGLKARPRLTVAGPAVDASYARGLLESARQLDERVEVSFVGQLSHEDSLRAMRSHSILAFPALWPEPSGVAISEAMAAGLAIVTSATGGAGELLADERDCLVAKANDADEWAAALGKVIIDGPTRMRLGTAARATAQEWSADRGADEVERRLVAAAAAANETVAAGRWPKRPARAR
jgi:glycogen synthase